MGPPSKAKAPLNEAEIMLKIVCALMSRPESEPFLRPLDWKRLGLHDYPTIVKKPMDLGTVKKNIEKGKYKSKIEVANDIRMVWSNCMAYNQDGSEFYHLADTFARKFEEVYDLLRGTPPESDPYRIPKIEDRIKLTYDLFKLADADIARVLTIIEDKSPLALRKKVSNGEVLLVVDFMPPIVFHEVAAHVTACTPDGRKRRRERENGAEPEEKTVTVKDKKGKDKRVSSPNPKAKK